MSNLTPTSRGEIAIYHPDNTIQLEVVMEQETVWLTQAQIAELFGTKRPAITKHLNNIYKSGELDELNTCSILEHLGNNAAQMYQTRHYNLDAILSVGYRVNSKNATLFRIWANQVLKEYILKGYAVSQRFERIEQRVSENEKQIAFFVKTRLPPVEGIFYDGQTFDAYVFVSDLIRTAKRSIVLIDNYVDESVLFLLSKRANGVSATIRTANISQQLNLDLRRHNSQYPPIEILPFDRSHDRFLLIDDDVYHIGASLKDLGKKCFAFSKMNLESLRI